MSATPNWFIAGPSLASVGEQRAAAQRESGLATLQQIFPEASSEQLRAAMAAGGDLTVIVDRLLAGQFVEGNGQEGSSSSNAPGPAPGPVRRVRFRPTEGLEQMEYDGIVPDPMPVGSDGAHHGGEMSRLSDEELCEQMASSGITAEPVSGSARGAALSGGNDVVDANEAALGEMVQAGGLEELRTQPVAVLASGALRLNARVIRTTNDLEPGYMSEKIVTKFIIECRQLSFRWEVARRYSEFHRFHELLALQVSEC